MTSFDLIQSLASDLEKVMKSYHLSDSEGNTLTVEVHKYYLREVDGYEEQEHRFPYIIVRPIEGYDEQNESVTRCAIIVAVKDLDSESGYKNTVNIIERIRQYAMTTLGVGNRYPIKRPITWAIDNEPNAPVYMGYVMIDANIGHMDTMANIPFLIE